MITNDDTSTFSDKNKEKTGKGKVEILRASYIYQNAYL